MRRKLICKVRCSENYTSVLIFTLILRQLAQIASGTAFGLVDVFIASSLKANQRLFKQYPNNKNLYGVPYILRRPIVHEPPTSIQASS